MLLMFTIVFGTAECLKSCLLTFAFIFLFYFFQIVGEHLFSHLHSIFKRSERSGAKVFALQIHHLSGFSSVIETSRILTLHLTISCQLIELSRGCTCNRCSCRCVNKASLIEHKQQGHSTFQLSFISADSLWEGLEAEFSKADTPAAFIHLLFVNRFPFKSFKNWLTQDISTNGVLVYQKVDCKIRFSRFFKSKTQFLNSIQSSELTVVHIMRKRRYIQNIWPPFFKGFATVHKLIIWPTS